ncbi:hypothetical protein T552_00085 [Pneumocystis carinii B80]|uniref:Mediator of RNA polymerase II transcription subunit 15 n=1 Tax=Pneumocystis carinii (strain B80) TaxID=1408658 RepID=A0A0W4ZSV3_PNEC8|nr:hypothetical protein T552_00085 [Pneumocystis carinii B80]KTW31443.1 hypothetical protein T552_00085 [Pneumocystis carinii B80]
MNQVPIIAGHNEGTNVVPDRNWRSTLTASEKHAIIFHLVSALRAVSSNVSQEHLIAIVNAFEKQAYEKANSKTEYINICNNKLMYIKGSAAAKQHLSQAQNQRPTMSFFPQIPCQQIVSGQMKAFEMPGTSNLVSPSFTHSPRMSRQPMSSHSQFQQVSPLLNQQMTLQQKQMLMRQASVNQHLSDQNLMPGLNHSVNQQSHISNSASDPLKRSPYSVPQQKASQIQQMLNQLQTQNNQQQIPKYMSHQACVSQGLDERHQTLNQQKIHMSPQTDIYQQCVDNPLLNSSNVNLQKLLALNQAIQSQNKQINQPISQNKQLLSNQTLQNFLSQVQAPVQQVVNQQAQKMPSQVIGSFMPSPEFKKKMDPYLNPCNYLIPQRILSQFPELPTNVYTWSQVAELIRNQRLSPEQVARVHELFYQHALYLQLHYQQIQHMSNQSVNQFRPQPQLQPTSQHHSVNLSPQIQQQMRKIPVHQMQQISKGNVSSEFLQPEWFSEASNFPTQYPCSFSPNVNVSLNNQTSQQLQSQSIDQLLTMVQCDNTSGLKKKARASVKVKKKDDIRPVNDQSPVSRTSNMASVSTHNQQPAQIRQDSPKNQPDISIVQRILMCGGKEANIQMTTRLRQIQNEVERNGVKCIPLNDLTQIQKQQVCELIAEMSQMYHRIDMLLPLFMILSWNESAIMQLLQMKLIYKNQLDVLPQGIYLCYPSQLIKIKKMISEYFKFVKISVQAIQKQIENGKSLPDKIPINLSEIDPNISSFQPFLVDFSSLEASNEASLLKPLKTDIKINAKVDNPEEVLINENRFGVANNSDGIDVQNRENSISNSFDKADSQTFELPKDSFDSQENNKIIEDPLDYPVLNVTNVLETDDVNMIFSMDKSSLLNEEKNMDVLSNKFGSEIISSLVTKIPQSLTNIPSNQFSGKVQNDSNNNNSAIENDKSSSDLTMNFLENEKLFSPETSFPLVTSDVLDTEKTLNDSDFEQYLNSTFSDKFYENNTSNFDKLQEKNVESLFFIDETNVGNGLSEELEWDFGVSDIGSFKIKDFYASNNENIWNEELKTEDLSTIGLGIIANVY